MVVKSKQGTPKLLVLEQCRSVVNQILLITDNEKKFPSKYQAITQRIIDTSLEMY